MKKHFLAFLLGLCLPIFFSFQIATTQTNPSIAEVNKIEGFYIFTDSRPMRQYDSLGTVDIGFLTGTQYEQIRNHLIKRAKLRFPNANGLIMKFNKKGVDQGIVIKLNAQ
ncbi:MAG: hypothetical protein ACOVP5_08640 [Chitinophagales bacterium]